MNPCFALRSNRWLVPGRVLMLALTLVVMFKALPTGPQSAAADDNFGSVDVHVHACDSFAGFPPTDMDTLMDACDDTPVFNDVQFFVTSGGKTTKGQPANNNLDWTWEGIPNQTFGIRGYVLGYPATPIVFCQNGAGDGYELMQATSSKNGGHVSPTMAEGFVTCEWFAMANSPENTGSVSIDVFKCPADFDYAKAEMNDFFVGCKDRANGVQIDLDADLSSSGHVSSVTGENADGNVFWPYVEDGWLGLTNWPVPGYDTERIYCRSQLHPSSKENFDGIAGIAWELNVGEKLECDWYLVPELGVKVTILNHLCPDGDDLTKADVYTLTAACTMPMNGVTFTLESSEYGTPFETREAVTGSTMASGIVWFDVVAADTTVTELPPAGYLAPRVFCQFSDPESGDIGSVFEATLTGNSLTLTNNGGSDLRCDWFNLPDHGESQAASITVYPTACPAGFDPAANDLLTSLQNCSTPQDGTRFDLTSSTDALSFTSGWYEAGVATLFGVPVQDGLSLTANPLDGLQSGAVWCGQDLLANEQVDVLDPMPLSGNTIPLQVLPGARATCVWFMESIYTEEVDYPDAAPDAETPEADAVSDPAATPATDAPSGDDQGDPNTNPNGDSGSDTNPDNNIPADTIDTAPTPTPDTDAADPNTDGDAPAGTIAVDPATIGDLDDRVNQTGPQPSSGRCRGPQLRSRGRRPQPHRRPRPNRITTTPRSHLSSPHGARTSLAPWGFFDRCLSRSSPSPPATRTSYMITRITSLCPSLSQLHDSTDVSPLGARQDERA